MVTWRLGAASLLFGIIGGRSPGRAEREVLLITLFLEKDYGLLSPVSAGLARQLLQGPSDPGDSGPTPACGQAPAVAPWESGIRGLAAENVFSFAEGRVWQGICTGSNTLEG